MKPAQYITLLFFIFFIPQSICFLQANSTNLQLSRVITNGIGDSITITETHQQVVNMPINKIFTDYGENSTLIFTQHMFDEVNLRRQKLNLPLLAFDNTLSLICSRWSHYMAENKVWWHSNNWKSSSSMVDRSTIIQYRLLRENVTYEAINATIFEIVENWQFLDDERDAKRGVKREDKRNHKTPIISPDVMNFGCGFATDNEDIYVTMISGDKF